MKILYNAYTCQGNVGDILINKYLIEEYAKYADVYIDCEGMPNEFQNIVLSSSSGRVHNFKEIEDKGLRSLRIFQILKQINKKGFTIYTRNPGPLALIQMPILTFIKRLILYSSFLYAQRQHLGTILIGVDINLPNNSFLRWINVSFLKRINEIVLRSQDNVNKTIKFIPNIKAMPDMAFLSNDIDMLDVEPIHNTKKIAICFRKSSEFDNLVKSIIPIIHYLKDKGYSVDIIYQVEEDQKSCELLYDKLRMTGICYRNKMIKFEDLDTYRNYDIIISNRLHVLLMGIVHGALSLGIISHSKKEDKIKSLFSSVFENKYCFYYDEISELFYNAIEEYCFSVRKQKEVCIKLHGECRLFVKSIIDHYNG